MAIVGVARGREFVITEFEKANGAPYALARGARNNLQPDVTKSDLGS